MTLAEASPAYAFPFFAYSLALKDSCLPIHVVPAPGVILGRCIAEIEVRLPGNRNPNPHSGISGEVSEDLGLCRSEENRFYLLILSLGHAKKMID